MSEGLLDNAFIVPEGGYPLGIGTRNVAAGSTILFVVDYTEFLYRGTILETFNVAVSGSTTSTVHTAGLTANQQVAKFYVATGSVQETFAVNITATDDNGQTVVSQVTVNVETS